MRITHRISARYIIIISSELQLLKFKGADYEEDQIDEKDGFNGAGFGLQRKRALMRMR